MIMSIRGLAAAAGCTIALFGVPKGLEQLEASPEKVTSRAVACAEDLKPYEQVVPEEKDLGDCERYRSSFLVSRTARLDYIADQGPASLSTHSVIHLPRADKLLTDQMWSAEKAKSAKNSRTIVAIGGLLGFIIFISAPEFQDPRLRRKNQISRLGAID